MCRIEQLAATCEAAARAGGKVLLDWQGRFSTQEKSPRDLVTDADLASQQAILAEIRIKFPDHGFLGEEDPDMGQLERPYCWIVDPLDGTTNYVHGFPFFGVSVAVVHAGRLAAGVVFDPLREECFRAVANRGSMLNGQRISVSMTTELDQALLAVSFPPEPRLDDPDVRAFLQVAPRCRAVRRSGSAALNLAYVACGRLDAHWAHFIHPWDSAAGVLLVNEAGGISTDSHGESFRISEGDYFVAATNHLHTRLLPLLIGD